MSLHFSQDEDSEHVPCMYIHNIIIIAIETITYIVTLLNLYVYSYCIQSSAGDPKMTCRKLGGRHRRICSASKISEMQRVTWTPLESMLRIPSMSVKLAIKCKTVGAHVSF